MKAYVLAGHSCDIVRPDGEMDEKIIPPGCKYVTIEVCGDISISYNLYKLFYTIEHNRINDVLKTANQTKLRDWFDNSNIVIHTAGERYINSRCTFINNNTPTFNSIDKSGMYEVGQPFLPIHRDDNPTRYRTEIPPSNMISHDMIASIYKGSIIPDASHLVSILPNPIPADRFISTNFTVTLDGQLVDITQDILFRMMPGVYYNFLCRVPCSVPVAIQGVVSPIRLDPDPVARYFEKKGYMANTQKTVKSQLQEHPLTRASNRERDAIVRHWINTHTTSPIRIKSKVRRSVKAIQRSKIKSKSKSKTKGKAKSKNTVAARISKARHARYMEHRKKSAPLATVLEEENTNEL